MFSGPWGGVVGVGPDHVGVAQSRPIDSSLQASHHHRMEEDALVVGPRSADVAESGLWVAFNGQVSDGDDAHRVLRFIDDRYTADRMLAHFHRAAEVVVASP